MIQLTQQSFALPTAPRVLTIGAGELHLWRVALDRPHESADFLHKRLSEEEQLRAGRFISDQQAARYVITHAALRNILARYLKLAESEIQFGQDSFGKPRLLTGNSLTFNLTHSGDLAVVAVAVGFEVGVDIEKLRLVSSFPRMVERCLSEIERKEISRLAADDCQHVFLRLWTHKEAYLKTVGVGLRQPLDQVTIDLCSPDARKVVNHFDLFPQTPTIRLMELNPCDGYVGAVGSTHRETPEVRTFAWTP